MRIYISLDAEGATGLCDFSEVEPQSPLYHRGVTAMERDLRAVLEGAGKGGLRSFTSATPMRWAGTYPWITWGRM